MEARMPQGGVYTFRGVRRSYNDTLAGLLDALAAPKPDPDTGTSRKAIADQEQRDRHEYFLTTLLGRRRGRVEPGRGGRVVDARGNLLAGQPVSPWLTATLATDAEIAARHLALTVMAHGTGPL